MTDLFQTFKNLGPARMAAIGIVTIGILSFFIYLSSRLTTPHMALLFNELSSTDSANIGAKLEAMAVPFEVSADGTQVLVAADQVGKLRMSMAAEGLPSGGSVGYEIFNDNTSFGVTNFVQNINHLRALEGELARTISTLAPIQSARVHLVLPKRELFNKQEQKATASVFVKTKSSFTLNRQQIAAIQHLVATAVPQLNPTQISIIDSKGNLLAKGSGEGTDEYLISSIKEQQVNLEMRLTDTIEKLLGKSLGYDKVRAEVRAELNFDRITSNTESYDPDGQVIRSTQTVEEKNNSENTESAGATSVTQNLPAGGAGNDGAHGKESGNRTEETVNYEITKTIKSEVKEIGQIKKLSVAVLVDGVYEADSSGAKTYKPRPKDELDKIETLVKSAVGFSTDRGDTIEVVNMQFVDEKIDFQDANASPIVDFLKQDLVKVIELSIMGIVSILVLLLVIRPVLMRLLEKTAQPSNDNMLAFAGVNEQIQQIATRPTLTQQQSNILQIQKGEGTDEKIDQMIDMNQVEGKVRASSIKKVGEIVDKHPEEAVSIIRSWLHQE